MGANLQNWAGHHTYSAVQLHLPETIEQLQELVSRSSKIKVLGSRHSFNDIADSTEALVSLENLAPTFVLDRERSTEQRNAPRTLDIDLIQVGDRRVGVAEASK